MSLINSSVMKGVAIVILSFGSVSSIQGMASLPPGNLREARQAYREGRLDDAKREYEQLVRSKPANLTYLAEWLLVLLQRDDWSEALSKAKEACKQHPRAAALWALLGKAQFRAGELEAAGQSFEKALQLNPDEYHALVGSAQLAMSTAVVTRSGSIEVRLQRAVALYPERGEVYESLAQFYQSLGQMQLAAQMMREFLKCPAISATDQLMVQLFPGMIKLIEALGLATPFAVKTLQNQAEAPLEIYPTHLMASVYLNGQGPFSMIFDTGGSFLLMLDSNVAQQLHLQSLSDLTALGVGGTAAAHATILDTLTIGSLTAQTVPAAIYDMAPVAEKMGVKVDGVFGAGLLQNLVVELDLTAKKIFFRACSEIKQVQSFQDRPALDMQKNPLQVPFLLLGDAKICVPVWIRDIRHWAIVDSGAGGEIFSAYFAAHNYSPDQVQKQTLQAAGIGDQQEAMEVVIGPAVTLELGGRPFTVPAMIGMPFIDQSLSRHLGMEFSLIVGNPILQQAERIVIDYPNQCLELFLPQVEQKKGEEAGFDAK